MAYCDYICCRDCKSKFIYDGDNNIRRSLEFAYGDENAPNWTVELVCPNCLARLERKPLTNEEIDAACGPCDDSDLARGFRREFIKRFRVIYERLHGIGGKE